MEHTSEELAKIVKHYEAQRRAWAKYNERRRNEKKEAGTYRPRGRPRKDADKLITRNPESAEVGSSESV